MSEPSFTSEVRAALTAVQIKSRCCRKALLFGMLYPASDFAGREIRLTADLEKSMHLFTVMARSVCHADLIWESVSRRSRRGEAQELWRLLGGEECFPPALIEEFAAAEKDLHNLPTCENCFAAFIRGVFLTAGTIVSPSSAYHVEFALSDPQRSQSFADLLCELGFSARITTRRGVRAVYLKESEVIEDLLTFIGAPQVALQIMNTKIMRDIRNNENRRANCDAANIYKSTGAAALQIRSIKRLQESGKLATLPTPLQITAELRLEHPEVSLIELAGLHEPPITKSGVSHRLQKLIDAAEEIEE
ncbi:MAG: DNA-binding protein WhiA [Clostridia bacterium]|nr:DNA-binding protein WhiA [Clostridia bacterium]